MTAARSSALITAAVLVLAACAACTGAAGDDGAVMVVHPAATTTVAPPATIPAEPPTAVPSTTSPPPAPSLPSASPAPAPAAPVTPRHVTEQPWVPFAIVGGITLTHPASRVERIGFHQANHDGARQLEPVSTAASPVTLETRDRLTDSRTAADVVVDPSSEIRSPVTGTVIVSGTYVLYCDYTDDYVIIEPDAHPGWEVKVLHINGVTVGSGDRVTAANTVLAAGPTQLPFESQVDEVRTTDPAWPHVHIEVIDPTIPDIPSPGDDC